VTEIEAIKANARKIEKTTEAELKTKFDKQNKEAVERLKNKRQLDEDEIAELDEELEV